MILGENDLVFGEAKQKNLSDKYISKNQEMIQTILEYSRESVDKHLNKKNSNYPIGKCTEISDLIFKIIEAEKKDVTSPFYIFQKLEKKGGIFKKVYGIQHGKYFQNGIQLADHFLDVANDTVDKNKAKIEISPLSYSGMENFSTYERYIEVAEKYWGFKAYPNIYFPHLAPLFPIIFITKDKKISIPHHAMLILYKDSELYNFKLAENFLFNSKYSNRQLPQEYIDKLSNIYSDQKELSRFINCHELAKQENFIKRLRTLGGDKASINYINSYGKKGLKLIEEISDRI